VEFGLFTAHSKINDLEPGTYVAFLELPPASPKARLLPVHI